MLASVLPDNDVVYIVNFETGTEDYSDIDIDTDTENDTESVEYEGYKICHFVFDGISNGFITKNGQIYFNINGDEIIIHENNKKNAESKAIIDYFSDKIKKHCYIDFNNLFYLSK
jgi:hypothetical protein